MAEIIQSKAQALLLVATVLASIATFAVVQDRVTAAGARRYVELQREAAAGRARPVNVDDVMRPAVRQSVRYGVVSAGAVALVGGATIIALRRGAVRSAGGRRG